MNLKYGKDFVNVNISSNNLLETLAYKDGSVEPLAELLKKGIVNPIGKPRLRDLLRKNKPHDLVIIVSDITRSIANYSKILNFLVSEIIDTGIDEKNIEFVVALGTHEKHTEEQNKQLYGNLVSDFRFSFHDCYNNLASLGKTSTGLEVQVNKRVKDADFVIATGRINFHYMAGFSGGRKAILPGISSYETIRGNHCKLRRKGVGVGRIEKNIIPQEMAEAARLFGLDYILNVVETPDHETAQIFCGDLESAFDEGVSYFKSKRSLKISEKADCIIVSAGGYPYDKNFYLSHKVLNTMIEAVKIGGSIVLIAQCGEGFGNEKFLNHMLENNPEGLLHYPEEKIEIGGHRAFVTSKILRDYKIYVLSELDPDVLSKMNFIPIKELNSCIIQIKQHYGQSFKVYIVPDGRNIMPVLNGGQN
jgi:nickel-dependent lactate racemase